MLAGDGAEAYEAAQLANAVLMASAGVPAYLFARMVLERSDAVLVAALTVATPLLEVLGVRHDGALFYPGFLWTAYAVASALARPSATLQTVAVGSLVFMCRSAHRPSS